MAICEHCGCELHGQYCDMCGAKAHEEVSTRRARQEQARQEQARQEQARQEQARQEQARQVPVGPPPEQAEPVGKQRPHRAQARQQHEAQQRRLRQQAQQQRRTQLKIAGVALAIFGCGLLVGLGMAPSKDRAAAVGGAGSEDYADLSPAARAEALVTEGIGKLEAGEQAAATERFRKAAVQYEAAVRADPENLFLRTYLGLTYFYTGDALRARTTQLEVLDRDPNYLWAIFNLAWIQEQSGKSGEALQLYQRYLDVAPTEKENVLKYAEQYELIDTQIDAAKQSLPRLQGSGGQ